MDAIQLETDHSDKQPNTMGNIRHRNTFERKSSRSRDKARVHAHSSSTRRYFYFGLGSVRPRYSRTIRTRFRVVTVAQHAYGCRPPTQPRPDLHPGLPTRRNPFAARPPTPKQGMRIRFQVARCARFNLFLGGSRFKVQSGGVIWLKPNPPLFKLLFTNKNEIKCLILFRETHYLRQPSQTL